MIFGGYCKIWILKNLCKNLLYFAGILEEFKRTGYPDTVMLHKNDLTK